MTESFCAREKRREQSRRKRRRAQAPGPKYKSSIGGGRVSGKPNRRDGSSWQSATPTPSAVTQRDRPKLPLLVLAAVVILSAQPHCSACSSRCRVSTSATRTPSPSIPSRGSLRHQALGRAIEITDSGSDAGGTSRFVADPAAPAAPPSTDHAVDPAAPATTAEGCKHRR